MKKHLGYSRKYSLAKKIDFDYVFEKPRKINHQHSVVLFRPNKLIHARLGIIAGKKVANSAVVRNRIKRIVRESFRLSPIRTICFDIVVIARYSCATLNKEQLRNSMDQLWEKLAKQHAQ